MINFCMDVANCWHDLSMHADINNNTPSVLLPFISYPVDSSAIFKSPSKVKYIVYSSARACRQFSLYIQDIQWTDQLDPVNRLATFGTPYRHQLQNHLNPVLNYKNVMSTQKQPQCKRCGLVQNSQCEKSISHYSHFLTPIFDFITFFILAILNRATPFCSKAAFEQITLIKILMIIDCLRYTVCLNERWTFFLN